MRAPTGVPRVAGAAAVKRALAVTTLAAVALLGASGGSAQAATARPLSSSQLGYPAAFTVTPHGARILYGERSTGRIRWLDTGTGASATFFTVPDVASSGEQGLLGLALSRNFPDDARVWAYVTPHGVGDDEEPAPSHPCGPQRLQGPAELPGGPVPQRWTDRVRPRRQALRGRR